MIERQPVRFCVRSAIFISYLLLISCSSTHASPVSPSVEPEVVYRIYKPIEVLGETIDSGFLLSTEPFPKLVELDVYQVMIKGFVIEKGPSGGFNASMEVEFQTEDRSLGFWLGRDPTAEYYSDENGCLLDVPLFCERECEGIDVCGGYDCRKLELYTNGGVSSNDCAGVLMIGVDRWVEPPSREEREAGIKEVLFTKGIYLDELDYDYSSNQWNYLKISLSLNREEKFIPMPE